LAFSTIKSGIARVRICEVRKGGKDPGGRVSREVVGNKVTPDQSYADGRDNRRAGVWVKGRF